VQRDCGIPAHGQTTANRFESGQSVNLFLNCVRFGYRDC
jgi:hypothetical protein